MQPISRADRLQNRSRPVPYYRRVEIFADCLSFIRVQKLLGDETADNADVADKTSRRHRILLLIRDIRVIRGFSLDSWISLRLKDRLALT
jgi:hypothetical protein